MNFEFEIVVDPKILHGAYDFFIFVITKVTFMSPRKLDIGDCNGHQTNTNNGSARVTIVFLFVNKPASRIYRVQISITRYMPNILNF